MNKFIPFIQFFYLGETNIADVFIENSQITFLNVFELLDDDCQRLIIQELHLVDEMDQELFKNVKIYSFPRDYSFRKIMIYQNRRMITHYDCSEDMICGGIELQEKVPIGLGKSGLEKMAHEIKL
jgi:hypothetical protein